MTDALAPSPFPEVAAPPPAAAIPSSAPRRVERFRFSGAGGEYFGIWIVNLLLTLVTLGIYSPWAKVRRKRYFYGNTWLADSNFEYHGNPVAILKGRIIAFVAFAAYTALTHYYPKAGAALLLAMMPAVPWLIVRTFAFNAVNSSYRNLRFHFHGAYGQALAAMWPFFLVPLTTLLLPRVDPKHPPRQFGDVWFVFVTPIVAGLLYPYVIAKLKRLQVSRSTFGTAPLRCEATVGQFYGLYAIAFLIVLVAGIGMSVIDGVVAFLVTMAGNHSPYTMYAMIGVTYMVLGTLVLSYTRSRVLNLVFNRSSIEGGWRFVSTLKARRLAALYATNLLAIACTLGLAMPWAAVRVARYRAQCLALEGEGTLDGFMAAASRDVAAAGEEMGEMFDVDLSL